MSDRRGQLDITLVALAEALGLPEGSRVVSVVGDVEQQTVRRTMTVVLEHPDLPEVLEGATPVRIMPMWGVDAEGRAKLVDWGL